ncbi:hypothetical protein ACOZFM_07890 [Streptomyces arboris]|uniref:hypothetical protein n=1 Tax=Streptomyces arboris TaxID=2600619 RepID=UPI003BF57C87
MSTDVTPAPPHTSVERLAPDDPLARLARTTAGVRLAVRTDAASIELEVENGSGGSPLDVRGGGVRDTPTDLITLELGINAYIRGGFTARTWGPAVCGFVETVRDGHPDTPVVVLTSLAASGREQAVNEAGMTLVETRAATAEAVRVLQRLGDRALHLVDGLTVVPVAEAGRVYADGLHPTAEGEYVLADRIGAALDKIPLN